MLKFLAAAAEATPTVEPSEVIDIGKNVLSSLDIFWKGMLSIAIVVAVIFLVVVLMNLISKQAALRKMKKESAPAETREKRLKNK